MTDRELIELAARAAGATDYTGPDDCSAPGIKFLNGEAVHYEGSGEWGYPWNPLTDDGDALRLAVQLRMFVSVSQHQKISEAQAHPDSEIVFEKHKRDAFAATRRAIVRAAAEIGRTMP